MNTIFSRISFFIAKYLTHARLRFRCLRYRLIARQDLLVFVRTLLFFQSVDAELLTVLRVCGFLPRTASAVLFVPLGVGLGPAEGLLGESERVGVEGLE